MEDQVLIPRENAHYLLLILIIHIGGLFPVPDTQQVKHARQGRYWSEIWCRLSEISFHRSDQTRFFRRIISVHSGWKLYYKTSLVPSGMHINDLERHAWSLSMERICRQFTHRKLTFFAKTATHRIVICKCVKSKETNLFLRAVK